MIHGLHIGLNTIITKSVLYMHKQFVNNLFSVSIRLQQHKMPNNMEQTKQTTYRTWSEATCRTLPESSSWNTQDSGSRLSDFELCTIPLSSCTVKIYTDVLASI